MKTDESSKGKAKEFATKEKDLFFVEKNQIKSIDQDLGFGAMLKN